MTTVTNKDGIEFDIDALATDVNGKADKDLSNTNPSSSFMHNACEVAEIPYVVSRTPNSQGGVVEIWSDGYCVQTGRGELNENSTTTITLTQAYKDTSYNVLAVSITASTASDTEAGLQCTPISTTQITLTAHYINPNSQTACWRTEGYIR